MNKKTLIFNRSFLLLVITLLFIGASIPTWVSRNQTPQVVSVAETQLEPEQAIVANQPSKEEEFQQQLMEMGVMEPSLLEQDFSRELVQEHSLQAPDSESLTEIALEGNMIKPDSVSFLKRQAQDRRSKRLFKEDQFNYQQKDVEELMLRGVSIEDIYLSDQIGNDWLISPRTLLEQKEKENTTWTVLESEIEEHVDQELSAFTLAMRSKNDQLNNQVPNKAERLVILKQLKENRELSMEQVMDSYKVNGQEGLQQLHEAGERGASRE